MLSPRSRSAFTLLELVVCVAILAMLSAVLLPALVGSMRSARTLVCASNVRQLALTTAVYAEQRGVMPIAEGAVRLDDLELPDHVWRCPREAGVPRGKETSYAYHGFAIPPGPTRLTPEQAARASFQKYLNNPELGLYKETEHTRAHGHTASYNGRVRVR